MSVAESNGSRPSGARGGAGARAPSEPGGRQRSLTDEPAFALAADPDLAVADLDLQVNAAERVDRLVGQPRLAWTPCAASNLPAENPRLRKTASSNDWRDRTSEPTPARIGKRDRADLEHDQEDRDVQVLDALLHERDQRVEPRAHLELGELGRREKLVGRSVRSPCGIRSARTNGSPTRSR